MNKLKNITIFLGRNGITLFVMKKNQVQDSVFIEYGAEKYYQKYRDMSLMFGVLIYLVNIIDANVDAHLKTFDLTDDISFKIQPTLTSPDMMNAVYGAKLTFAFK